MKKVMKPHRCRLKYLLAGAIASVMLLLVACASTQSVALATTPEPTPTATAAPTATQSPTIEPTPSPTPMPELTYEQKKLLLGINDNSTPSMLSQIQLVDFDLNDQEIRFCTVMYRNHDEQLQKDGYYAYDFYSIFDKDDGYLFTVSIQMDQETGRSAVGVNRFFDYITQVNPALEGIKPLIMRDIESIAYFYDLHGFDYNDNETLKNWSDIYASMDMSEVEILDCTSITPDELAEIFLDATDQEKILPYWKYVPGAQVPDELKEFYPDDTTLPEGATTSVPYTAPAN